MLYECTSIVLLHRFSMSRILAQTKVLNVTMVSVGGNIGNCVYGKRGYYTYLHSVRRSGFSTVVEQPYVQPTTVRPYPSSVPPGVKDYLFG